MSRLFSSLYNSTTLALALLMLQFGNLAADSLWKDGNARPMAADKKARAIGDILTVLIQESNGATRQNNTTTEKKASVNAAIASFLYGPTASGLLTKKGGYPALSTTFGTLSTAAVPSIIAETITAQMAVRVIDVLPGNGNHGCRRPQLHAPPSPARNRTPSSAAPSVPTTSPRTTLC